ncbi:hypothetical protein GW17_00035846, partial [Ensete ventricosum]
NPTIKPRAARPSSSAAGHGLSSSGVDWKDPTQHRRPNLSFQFYQEEGACLPSCLSSQFFSFLSLCSSSSWWRKVLVPVGMGTEEMEAVILVDVLRRAGADVLMASVEPDLVVEASSGIKLVADVGIDACADEVFDLVALPVSMISVIDVNLNCQITCHPAFMHKLPAFRAVKSNIQVSGELTTSRGPGTTFEFALSFAEQLFGGDVAEDIGRNLVGLLSDRLDFSCFKLHFLIPAHGCHQRKEELNKVEWFFDQTPDVSKTSCMYALRHIVANLLDIMTCSERLDCGGTAGVERLQKSRILKKLLREQMEAGRGYGGICSAPTMLHKHGLLKVTFLG